MSPSTYLASMPIVVAAGFSQVLNFGPMPKNHFRVAGIRYFIASSGNAGPGGCTIDIAKCQSPIAESTSATFSKNSVSLIGNSFGSGTTILLLDQASLIPSYIGGEVPLSFFPDEHYPNLCCLITNSCDTFSFTGFCGLVLDYSPYRLLSNG